MESRFRAREEELYSPAERIGELLKREFLNDPYFYFFSPDETTSNKFGAVFEVEKRAWGDLKTDKDDLPSDENGRIIEMLSENVLFSTMTGHLANGEQAMMGSYEAFFSIITSQILQQIKFIQQAKKVNWREPMPAVNLLSTSTCWRQDHNGFTHQSPALVSSLLAVPSGLVNCIFPVDDRAAEAAFEFMLASRDVVNLTTFNKIAMPRYLNLNQAREIFEDGGARIYDFVSDTEPDFVFTAVGDIMTREAIKAIEILREDLPSVKFRFVGINALSYRAIGTTQNQLSLAQFNQLFTTDKPIIANFHGYPVALETILGRYTNTRRLRIHGFSEEGSTTTPFEMLRRNMCSRFDLAIDVAKVLKNETLIKKYEQIMVENHNYALKYGEDLIKL